MPQPFLVRIGDILLGEPNKPSSDPTEEYQHVDPNPTRVRWYLEHDIVEYKIPGYSHLTQRASNKVLWKCEISGRCYNYDLMEKLYALAESTDPVVVESAHHLELMDLKTFSDEQKEGEGDNTGKYEMTFIQHREIPDYSQLSLPAASS